MKQKYSPMMMQYLGIKEQNKDAIKEQFNFLWHLMFTIVIIQYNKCLHILFLCILAWDVFVKDILANINFYKWICIMNAV